MGLEQRRCSLDAWHFFSASVVRLALPPSRGVPARRGWEIFQTNQAVTRQYQQGRQGQTAPNAQTVSGMRHFSGIYRSAGTLCSRRCKKSPTDALANRVSKGVVICDLRNKSTQAWPASTPSCRCFKVVTVRSHAQDIETANGAAERHWTFPFAPLNLPLSTWTAC